MAKKKKSTYSKKPVQQIKKEPKKGLLEEQKGPSKNEVLFFRIGMIVITAVILGLVVLFLINHFTSDDEVSYEDHIHITHTSLTAMVEDNGDNTYGDFTYFNGIDSFEDLRSLINNNDVIYFYFYYSSNINEDIEDAINNQSAVGGIPTQTLLDDNEDEAFAAFLFIDLDSASNGELMADTGLSMLELDADADEMLVTFDIYNPDGEFFSMEDDADDIIEIINQIG
jgi:hypothetical protein